MHFYVNMFAVVTITFATVVAADGLVVRLLSVLLWESKQGGRQSYFAVELMNNTQ